MSIVGCSCLSGGTGRSAHIEVLPARADAPGACTLGRGDLSVRFGAFAALFEHLSAATRLPAGFRWTFRNVPGLERQLRELARKEHACCPFLTFAISVDGDELVWRACGSSEAEAAIEAFYRMPEAPPDGALPLLQ
jgi:hypothetical protein